MMALKQQTTEAIKTALNLPDSFKYSEVVQVINYLMHDTRGKAEDGVNNVDHDKDYRYIYPSFLKLYGIDLNNQTISWWEYKMLFESCMFSDCMIKSVVEIRSRKIPHKADEKTRQTLSSLKHTYMLRKSNDGLGNMFKSLKGVAEHGS